MKEIQLVLLLVSGHSLKEKKKNILDIFFSASEQQIS